MGKWPNRYDEIEQNVGDIGNRRVAMQEPCIDPYQIFGHLRIRRLLPRENEYVANI